MQVWEVIASSCFRKLACYYWLLSHLLVYQLIISLLQLFFSAKLLQLLRLSIVFSQFSVCLSETFMRFHTHTHTSCGQKSSLLLWHQFKAVPKSNFYSKAGAGETERLAPAAHLFQKEERQKKRGWVSGEKGGGGGPFIVIVNLTGHLHWSPPRRGDPLWHLSHSWHGGSVALLLWRAQQRDRSHHSLASDLHPTSVCPPQMLLLLSGEKYHRIRTFSQSFWHVHIWGWRLVQMSNVFVLLNLVLY